MGRYYNSKKAQKINELSKSFILDDKEDKLSSRCKFNFHYFSPSCGGQDFKEWVHADLIKLLNKLKNYSENNLKYWETQGVLKIYGNFPSNHTDFVEPKNIPIDVKWGRFRFENKVRLAGFVIPNTKYDEIHKETNYRFDTNTFYVVYLDKYHKFYKTEKK